MGECQTQKRKGFVQYHESFFLGSKLGSATLFMTMIINTIVGIGPTIGLVDQIY